MFGPIWASPNQVVAPWPPTAKTAQAITDAGANYLLAVKANQSTLRVETEITFNVAEPGDVESCIDHDKGHGRIEQRTVSALHDVDWLSGRFPGEHRLPGAATIIRVQSRAELADRSRFETRYYVSSAVLATQQAAQAVRPLGRRKQPPLGPRRRLRGDQSRLRSGHVAKNMAVVRHFAINLARAVKDKRSIKPRRKLAGSDTAYLASLLGATCR